jgi:hypothetical protein
MGKPHPLELRQRVVAFVDEGYKGPHPVVDNEEDKFVWPMSPIFGSRMVASRPPPTR